MSLKMVPTRQGAKGEMTLNYSHPRKPHIPIIVSAPPSPSPFSPNCDQDLANMASSHREHKKNKLRYPKL